MIWRAFLCWLILAQPLVAQTEAAQDAAAQLTDAAAQLVAAQSARDRVAALTETVQAYEEGLRAMRDGLRRAALSEQQLTRQLQAKEADVAQLLGALQSMGRAPAPLLLLHPAGPLGTARGGMMTADLTPALQREVTALRDELAQISALRRVQEQGTRTLQEGLQGAQDARTALSQALSERRDLPQRFADDPVQTALLLSGTRTLEDFATSMAAVFLADQPAPVAAAANGALPLPLQGRLLRGFNAPDAAGVVRPGVIIAARPRALVATPVPATLLFRGPLLDYGNVVILEPAPDVLFVLAGLAEVFGEAGQILPAGSPLGLLGGETPPANAILTESETLGPDAATQTLYLEVREGQSPVDPARWFSLEQR